MNLSQLRARGSGREVGFGMRGVGTESEICGHAFDRFRHSGEIRFRSKAGTFLLNIEVTRTDDGMFRNTEIPWNSHFDVSSLIRHFDA